MITYGGIDQQKLSYGKLRLLTWKSVGSDVSQLRVQPTTGLKRAASMLAKLLTAFIAVWLVGFLYSRVNCQYLGNTQKK